MNINWQQIIKSSLGLKRWVLVWVTILFLGNTISLWYLDYPSGLWTAIAMFCFVIPVNLFLLFYQNGVTRAMSIPHFVWVISSVMIAYRLFFSSAEVSEEEMLFGIMILIINGISLVFDVLDTIKYLNGSTEVQGLELSATNVYKLYAIDFSLFSGKARSYLRKKGIPYEEVAVKFGRVSKFIIKRTGVRYIPVLQTPDDIVIQDTTVIIDELERRFPEHSVYPNTPKQKIVSLLLELYADEWLFIPALHYRWHYKEENYHYIHGKFGEIVWKKAPGPLRRLIGKQAGAEFRNMLPGLGVTDANYRSIEASYESFLSDFNAHLEIHDYVMGSKPCIADFGFMAPLYAHLYLDPAPGKLMREKAPAVVRWVKRMNDDEKALHKGAFLENDQVPETLLPILKRMAMEQLPTILDMDQRLTAWREENSATKEIDRYIGWHSFVAEGVEGTRRAQSYPNWMFQRSVDFYQSLENTADVDHLLDQVGMGTALRDGLKNRLERRKNLLQFAD